MWDFEQLVVQKDIREELRAIRALLEEAVKAKPLVVNRYTPPFPIPQYDDGRRVGSVGIDPR